jgi:hypothetical protein
MIIEKKKILYFLDENHFFPNFFFLEMAVIQPGSEYW